MPYHWIGSGGGGGCWGPVGRGGPSGAGDGDGVCAGGADADVPSVPAPGVVPRTASLCRPPDVAMRTAPTVAQNSRRETATAATDTLRNGGTCDDTGVGPIPADLTARPAPAGDQDRAGDSP